MLGADGVKRTKVPGTFETAAPPRVRRDLSPQGRDAEELLLQVGALHAERWLVGGCTVMLARERYKGEYRWHLSIAHPSRHPTWDEMKVAVYELPALELKPGRTMAQLLGKVEDGQWVNRHEHTFHWFEIDDPLR